MWWWWWWWEGGTFTQTLTPQVSLETVIKLMCMFLDYGRKPNYPDYSASAAQSHQPVIVNTAH